MRKELNKGTELRYDWKLLARPARPLSQWDLLFSSSFLCVWEISNFSLAPLIARHRLKFRKALSYLGLYIFSSFFFFSFLYIIVLDFSFLSLSFFPSTIVTFLALSPWYDPCGWLGVKQQFSLSLSLSLSWLDVHDCHVACISKRVLHNEIYVTKWFRSASSLSKIMSMSGPSAYLYLLMHILAIRMKWLIILRSYAVWVLLWKPSSAMVFDISKRVPVRLFISCSTFLQTGLLFMHAKKKCSM